MAMNVFVRMVAILFIGMTAPLSAAEQDDLDSLLRRLNDVEAEQAKSRAAFETQQAKSRETIEALRAEIEALAAGTQVDRLAEQPTDDTPDTATDVTEADAGIQASAPSKPLAARYHAFPELADESRFILKSEDERFEFGIDGLLTARYEVNHRRDDGTGSSNTDQGFEIVGARINFKGYLYEDFGYWVRLAADEYGANPAFDAIMGYYTFNNDTTLVVGSVPSILNRENGQPQDKLLSLESTATNYAFDPFGYKGIMLGHHTPRLVFRGIINDGYRSFLNSAFADASAEWAFAGQVQGMAVGDKGDWARFNNFTSRPGSGFAWMLNAAFHVQDGRGDASDPNDHRSDDVFLLMLESSMEGNGWNFYASGYYRETDGPSTAGIKYKDLGFVLQGGAWVSKHFEWYSRYDKVISDNDRPVENEDFRTLSTGINYYPFPHTDNIRFGLEGVYMFDAEAYSIVEPNVFNSIQASPKGDQWVIRAQGHYRW
jgi:hypothetical protein